METPLPVICDRCRAEGSLGEANFAELGTLLDFEPVPRKKKRVDGWNAERQRAFVAALAVTGSHRRAAAVVGKAQFGVDQLFKSEGSESFRAACDAAMVIARETGSRRLASGLSAVAGEAAAWAPPPGPWSRAQSRARPAPGKRWRARNAAPQEEWTTAQKAEKLRVMFDEYLIKVEEERKARLAGNIVAADFYVRQLTFIEVMFDLIGTDGFALLRDFRAQPFHLVDIVQTPISKILGDARRAKWAEMGEPPRPEHPPQDRLVDRGRFHTDRPEGTWGGREQSHEQQRQAFKDRHAIEAQKQLEWEAEARRDYERRRDSAADS